MLRNDVDLLYNIFSVQYHFFCCLLKTIEVLNIVGDGDSKSVLDAFFLGKALAEALNERIESTVGEFLSAIGRLQAEQQKQVQDFQVMSNSSCNRSTLESLLILSYILCSSIFFVLSISFITVQISWKKHIWLVFYCRQVKSYNNSIKRIVSLRKEKHCLQLRPSLGQSCIVWRSQFWYLASYLYF